MAGENIWLGFQSLKFRIFRACLSFVSKLPSLTLPSGHIHWLNLRLLQEQPHPNSAHAPPRAAFLCVHHTFALFGEPRSFAKVRICQCFVTFSWAGGGGGWSFSYHPSYHFRSCFANTMGFNFKLGNSLLLYDSTEISILIPFYSG